MESVPEAMQTQEMGVFLQALHSDYEEASKLEQSIARRLKERHLDGLLEQVNRALTLMDNRADLVALQQQLTERNTKLHQERDDVFSTARELLKQGQAKESFSRIQPCLLNNMELRSSDKELKSQLESILKFEDELWVLVKESNADGVLEPEQVVKVLVAAIQYLEMNPHHEKILWMKEQLFARIKKQPERYGFDLAKRPIGLEVLSKLPPWENSAGMYFKVLPTFSIGVHEVTQSQYESVMGSNPSKFKGTNNPVEMVSWNEAVAFCKKLSTLPAERAAGRLYRLPTEAEWEYACRKNTITEYSFGEDAANLSKYAWFDENSANTTHAVGEKLANGWGLYDMHGNVSEWCSDASGLYRVLRGGSWFTDAANCRSAFRFSDVPSSRGSHYGFRLALSSPSVKSPEAELGK
jgi:hypothetical protein